VLCKEIASRSRLYCSVEILLGRAIFGSNMTGSVVWGSFRSCVTGRVRVLISAWLRNALIFIVVRFALVGGYC